MARADDREDVRRFLAESAARPATKLYRLNQLHDFATWMESEGYRWPEIDWRQCIELVNRKGEPLGLGPIDPGTIDDYLVDLQRRRPTRGALNQAVWTLHAYFRFLHLDVKLVDSDPTCGLRLPPMPRRDKPALDAEDADRLIDELAAVPHGEMMCVVGYVLAWTGMRIHELLRLRPRDILWEEGVLRLYFTKTRDFDLRPIADPALEGLEKWLHSPLRNESPGVFPGLTDSSKHLHYEVVREAIEEAAERAGVTVHVTTHTLRRTFATLLTAAGMPEDEVGQLLGHRRRSSLPPYVSKGLLIAEGEKALERARIVALLDAGKLPEA